MNKIKTIKPLTQGIKLKISVPGSKSLTHRALIAAALADGQTVLQNMLVAEDTMLTLGALKAMGIGIETDNTTAVIKGRAGYLKAPSEPIYLENSGTSMRLLTGICALAKGRFVLTGNERMRQRPIQPLLEALQKWGVRAYSEKDNGCPPVVIESNGLEGGATEIDATLSSQFLSALLLAAPYAQKPGVIKVKGKLVSLPYVDLTLQVMEDFGIKVEHHDYQVFKIGQGCYKARPYTIEGDCSTASYFWAAAAVLKGEITVRPISIHTKQADFKLLDILKQMGCHIEASGDGVKVIGGNLVGVEVDMNKMPDVVPTLAVVAAFAKGKTKITGIGHLRHKESDRIQAVATELQRMGIKVIEGDDYLIIWGGNPQPAMIETYNDHRIAMSFAVAGLKLPGVKIINPECVKKSFPGFWETEMFK